MTTTINNLQEVAQRTARRGRVARLPDPSVSAPAYRPFASDPGWDEAWWWLGIPALVAAAVLAVLAFAPDLFFAWLLPEGYGLLELSHFFIPLAGLYVALRLLWRPYVRQRRLIAAFVVFAALVCLYIAGEEHSWGQHFFNWRTPDYWAEINRQEETNLHNMHFLFDKTPRALFEIGVAVGGLLVPILAVFWRYLRRNRLSLFLPASALFATAAIGLYFKIDSMIAKQLGIPLLHVLGIVERRTAVNFRAAEVTETFMYLFLLFYLITFARRISELEREAASTGG